MQTATNNDIKVMPIKGKPAPSVTLSTVDGTAPLGSPEAKELMAKVVMRGVEGLKAKGPIDPTRSTEDELKSLGVKEGRIKELVHQMDVVDAQRNSVVEAVYHGAEAIKRLQHLQAINAGAHDITPDVRATVQEKALVAAVEALEALVVAQQYVKALATKAVNAVEESGHDKKRVAALIKERKVSKAQLELELENERASMNKLHAILARHGVHRVGD